MHCLTVLGKIIYKGYIRPIYFLLVEPPYPISFMVLSADLYTGSWSVDVLFVEINNYASETLMGRGDGHGDNL